MRLGIINLLAGTRKPKAANNANENRPVKFVPDGENSWRVVWADGKAN